MFRNFLDFIRGVIRKMFGRETIADKLGINVAISNEMASKIDLWEKIYKDEAPWLKGDDIISLGLGASISNEFARLTTLEMKSEITGSKRADFLNSIYNQ